MPVTMDGLASGIKTNDIIKKLLEVEAKPIKQLQKDKKKNELRRDALKVLGQHLKDLNKQAKELFGFRASYDDKIARSSDPLVLEAVANRNALSKINKIEVLQIASTHKIATDPVDINKNLPAGKFNIEVNGESHSIKFRGGPLKKLRDRIDEVASDIVDISLIKSSESKNIITIESKITGKKGEIKIKGDFKLLNKIGLVESAKELEKKEQNIVFDRRYFTGYLGSKKIDKQTGSITVGREGKKIKLQGLLWQEYILPVKSEVKDNTKLEFNFSYKAPSKEDQLIPFKVELGPKEKINIKGIELYGYNISRIRPVEKRKKVKYDTILGVGVISEEKGKRTEKVYSVDKDSKGRQEIPIWKDFAGKTISKIIFFCNEGSAEFSDAKLVTPEKSKKGLYKAKNVITKAQNAKFKIDGIEVTREKNNGINDAIKGVTLNLKGTSKRPVELKVEPDIDKSIDKIKKFVEAYNKYIDFHKDLIKAEKVSKPMGRGGKKPKRGIFIGDMTIIRLENSLKRTIGAAYPNRADKQIKLLSDIGVSTGEINAAWGTIKDGKLVIDESKLRNTIIENPEGVKMFFGSDNDGDNRIDSGLAYSVVQTLKPYVSFGKNIISTKIDLENSSIKMADERIEKHEMHLKVYEEKLKRKFAKMEQAISGAKNQRNWMKNYFGGSGQRK